MQSPDQLATRERCEQLRLVMLQYQTDNPGSTPSIDMMIRELRVPESAIRLMLTKLERLGHILIISRHPLRVLVKTPGYNPAAGDSATPGKYENLLNVEGKRHQLGRYIGAYEAKFGTGPTLRQMMSYLQYDNAGWVHRSCEILAERGLVTFGKDMPTKLTQLGKQFYGIGKGVAKVDTAITDAPPPTKEVVLVPVEKKTRFDQTALIEKIGDYLGRRPRAKRIDQKMLAEQFGHAKTTVYDAVRTMIGQGLIEPRRKSEKTSLKLTAEGFKKFSPMKASAHQPAPRKVTPKKAVADKPVAPLVAQPVEQTRKSTIPVSLDEMMKNALLTKQKELASTLGFEPTLEQVMQYVLKKLV